jgi:Fe-S-cluster containining protein
MSDRRARVDGALARLAELLARTAAGVEKKRAFTCAGCDAHCCKVGRNGMLVTRLEAEAIVARLRDDPALRPRAAELARRVSDTVRRHALHAGDATGAQTYTCPFLDEQNRCAIHGRGQPLGCITFMPMRGGGCDQHVPEFETALDAMARLNDEVYGPHGWQPMLIPVAVERALAAGVRDSRPGSPSRTGRSSRRRRPGSSR